MLQVILAEDHFCGEPGRRKENEEKEQAMDWNDDSANDSEAKQDKAGS